MRTWRIIKQPARLAATIMLASTLLLSGMPSATLVDYIAQNVRERNVVDLLYLASKNQNVIDGGFSQLLQPGIQQAYAANFSMQTGYYMGTGASLSISGLGFQPDFILIKSNTTAGQAAFKTSAMAANSMAFVGATADNTTSQLTLDADGFSLGTNASVNSANVRYVWSAFSGSDCTSSGTFCVGQYTGNATSPRKIVTGFQPSLVIIKRTTAIAGHFHTASMGSNQIRYLTNTIADTSGNFIRSLESDGFNVGHSSTIGDNVSGATYNYIAFKSTAGVFAEGSYTGNATDNRSITGVGFKPDMVLVKNGSNATANNTRPVMNVPESYGDSGSILTATANTVNTIQALENDGFQVGTSVFANGSGDTYYWAAFAGVPSYTASGTYEMATGTYTGNGTGVSISDLAFAPDLVIIKDEAANHGVFRTRLMSGDITAYMAAGTADFAGGITALTNNGFTIGNSTIVNTASNTYHWQAFGNAWNPYTNSGASDFAIGVYYGSGTDNRNITRLPWQPSFVALKRNSTTAGGWRSSALTGDLSSHFAATAEATNIIQALNTDGFQVGTSAVANSSASLYRWFAFKTGDRFAVGSYTGNGSDDRDLTEVGFEPDLVWIKRSTTVAGVHRASTLAGDLTQYFANTANAAGRIKAFIANGFRLGTQTEVNQGSGIYRYAAWKKSPTNSTPTITLDTPDEYLTSDTTPTLSFTGYDLEYDDLVYNIQIDASPDFDSDNSGTLMSDDFNDNSIDTNKWDYYNGSTYVAEADQVLKINSTAFNRYDGLVSKNTYDLTSKSVTVEMADPGDLSINNYETFPLNATVNTDNYVGFTLSDSSLKADRMVSGSLTSIASTTFNHSNMRWLRIAEESGSTYWQYSADNANWNNLASASNPINMTSVKADMIAGNWSSGASQFTALQLDNFYIGGALGPLIDRDSETDAGFVNLDTPADTNPFNADETIDYTVQAGDELALGTYYWRVRVMDPNGSGQWSSWSATRSFTIQAAPDISITIISDGEIDYGTLGSAESINTLTLGDTQTIYNNGGEIVDINIKSNQPSGWTLGSSPASDVFVHEFSTNSGSNWTKFSLADEYQLLSSALAVDATQNFDLRFVAPNPSSTSDQKTITITVQAIAN